MSKAGAVLTVLFLIFAANPEKNRVQNPSADKTKPVFTSAPIVPAAPKINVEAKTAEEKDLIRWLINNVYPDLEQNQKTLIDNGLFFVMNYDKKIAAAVLAFGPEDDPEYEYPDKNLYPDGTIKINFTFSMLDSIRPINSPDIDPRVKKTLRKFLIGVIAHEIKHAEQYMEHPVSALSAFSDCPEGICDPQKLKDTRIKMRYEFEATFYGWEVGIKSMTAEEWSYARNWMENNPKFKEGFFAAISQSSFEDLSAPIPEYMQSFYWSMFYPAAWAEECAEGTLSAADKDKAKKFLGASEQLVNILENTYSYLPPVVERLKTCVQE